MNSVERIRQAMVKRGIPEEMIARFSFPESPAAADVISLIERMDLLLSPRERMAVMEEQGCCKTGKPHKAHRDFGKKYADKPLAEKISLLSELETPHNPPCRLNPDGTLSVYWAFPSENGLACVCSCSMIKELKAHPERTPSLTFCGCCAGHSRHHLQNSLGVKLRLKEIVSSALNSGGARQCEFLFDIL